MSFEKRTDKLDLKLSSLIRNIGLITTLTFGLLTYLGTSKGTAMTSGTPIVTIIFATIILNEIFTIFHIIGTLLVIFSVLMIVKPRKDEDKSYKINYIE